VIAARAGVCEACNPFLDRHDEGVPGRGKTGLRARRRAGRQSCHGPTAWTLAPLRAVGDVVVAGATLIGSPVGACLILGQRAMELGDAGTAIHFFECGARRR